MRGWVPFRNLETWPGVIPEAVARALCFPSKERSMMVSRVIVTWLMFLF